MSRITGSDASQPISFDADEAEDRSFVETSYHEEQTITSSRFRCRCGAWHNGRHVIDGVEVASLHCKQHATDHWRGVWATYHWEDDPRPMNTRFKPHHVRTAHGPQQITVAAIKQRTDLLEAPGDPWEPLFTGDYRESFVPLDYALEASRLAR